MSDHGDEEEDDEIGDTISEEDENALAAALVDGSDESLGGSESSREEGMFLCWLFSFVWDFFPLGSLS